MRFHYRIIVKERKAISKAKTILANKNLLVNEDKTEVISIKRKEMETEEEWRNVIKLGSKLGYLEGQTLHYQTMKQYGKRNGKQS